MEHCALGLLLTGGKTLLLWEALISTIWTSVETSQFFYLEFSQVYASLIPLPKDYSNQKLDLVSVLQK